jgi:DNA-binding beta-propeller fold protein YncE
MKAVIAISIVSILALSLAGIAVAQEEGTTVATGLNGPQGILVAPDGSIWVADSGMGGEEQIGTTGAPGEESPILFGQTARVVQIAPDGTQTVAATLPSIAFGQEIAGAARLALLDGTLYVASSFWIDAAGMESRPLAAVVASVAGGQATEVADTWAFEVSDNPDPYILESHPYDLEVGPDGMLWVTEAGGNALLKVDPASGEIQLVTVFAGLPSPVANPNRGGAQESDPVPTGIAFDASGNAYVSFLPGFPFLPGTAKVVQVGSDGAVSDYATGLTMLTDLQSGPDGMLYAVSIGQFTEQGPVPNTGAVLRIQEGEASEVLLNGLSFPTSIDFDDAGDAYVTLNGVGAPGSGQVARFDGLTSMTGSSLADATAAAVSESAAQPQALPETGAMPLHAGWLAVVLGIALVMAALLLGARQRSDSTSSGRES